MKNIFASIVVISAAVLSSGCATIISGTHQKMSFKSLPSGAEVYVNDEKLGVTPISAEIGRSRKTQVRVVLAGYETDQFKLKKRVEPWRLLDFIVPGRMCSSTTDKMTGAAVEYEPDHYYCVLDPAGSTNGVPAVEAQRRQLARFIAVNDSPLSQDIAAGKGEYLDAVWQILEISRFHRGDALKRLRAVRAQYPQTVEFAEAAGRELTK